MEDVSEGLSSKAVERMEEKLSRLPASYRASPDAFNPFAHVIAILRSEEPRQSSAELDRHCRAMDAVRRDLVDGTPHLLFLPRPTSLLLTLALFYLLYF